MYYLSTLCSYLSLLLVRGPEFCDPMPPPVSRYVREYASYLDALRFMDMRASALNVGDRHDLWHGTDVRAWVKPRLHCGERGMSLSLWLTSKVDCAFVRWYEEVQYETDLSTLVQCFNAQRLPEIVLVLVVLPRPYSHSFSPNVSVI